LIRISTSSNPEEKAKIKSTPGSLGESYWKPLKKDHDYLLQGNVFTEKNSSRPGSTTRRRMRWMPSRCGLIPMNSISTTISRPRKYHWIKESSRSTKGLFLFSSSLIGYVAEFT